MQSFHLVSSGERRGMRWSKKRKEGDDRRQAKGGGEKVSSLAREIKETRKERRELRAGRREGRVGRFNSKEKEDRREWNSLSL